MKFPFRALTLFCAILLSGCWASNPTQQTNATESTKRTIDTDRNCDVSDAQLSAFEAPDYQQLWDRLRAGYGIEHQHHARIDKHLRWYQTHPKYMERVSKRAEKYLFHIVDTVEQHDLPMELALLPIVESAFDPFAYSHGSASGMWQFISSTGKHYGLEQNWWYDGRRDVVAATDAAVRYLAYLHRRFDGNWLHALAAYNAGEGNVRKAIRRNRKLGRPTDFWSLKLPNETKAYVPQLLALSKIVMDPAAHDITLTPIPNTAYFASVDIGSQIDLAQASSLSGVSITDLYQLNPGFNRWATAPSGPHRLLVPVARAQQFRDNLKQLPVTERVSWHRYTIKNGDSLITIAKKFNTDVATLRDTNNIKGHRIRAGKTLMIPQASKSQRAYALSSNQRIAKKQAAYGRKPGNHKVEYIVRQGDSFWSIAKKYGVGVRELAKWNSMAPKDTLRKNQKLVVWTKTPQLASVSGAHPATHANSVIRKVSYRVRRGDSLARIANKFNVSVSDIVRWNPVNANSYIHPGQPLTLFVDVTRIN